MVDLELRYGKEGEDYSWIRSKLIPILDQNEDIKKWIEIVEDISLRKEYEMRLIKKEKDYLEILDSSNTGFFIMDFEKEEAIVSPTWQKRFKQTHNNPRQIFINAYNLLHPEDRDRVKKFDEEAMKNGIRNYSNEYRIKMQEGNYVWIYSQVKLLFNEEGKAIKSFGTHIDISDRKLVEKELIESRRRAKQLVAELRKSNEAKDKLISTISHEMRNPLSTMIMGLTLLDQVEADNSLDLDTRKIIKRQVKQLAEIVNGLIHSNKLSRNTLNLKKKETELNQLIKESIKDYKPCFDDLQIGLLGEFYPEDIKINLDTIRIKQVIGNLLSNALKFTDKGGQVKIKVAKNSKRDLATIEVEDTGVGISPEDLNKMFEEFTQLDNSSKTRGLGLGLSIVQGIIDLHGGSVRAASPGLGRGSKFIINLPI